MEITRDKPESPTVCPDCGKMFKQNIDKVQHWYKIHAPPCPRCGSKEHLRAMDNTDDELRCTRCNYDFFIDDDDE